MRKFEIANLSKSAVLAGVLSVFLLYFAITPAVFGYSKVSKEGKEEYSIVDWFPRVTGLLRYTFWFKEGLESRQLKNEIDRLCLWIDQELYKDISGIHAHMRYQEGRLGSYPSNIWLEEGYIYAAAPPAKIKIGKIHTPFGLLWDHTYYGSLIYYKGYMYDPDYGVVIEGKNAYRDNIDLNWSAGYFLKDDELNGATVLGQGFEKTSKGERNTFALRANSAFRLSDNSTLSFGGSAQAGRIKSNASDRQAALEADIVWQIGPLSACTEYVYYDQDFHNRDSSLRGYLIMAEGNLSLYKNPRSDLLRDVSLRYNFSVDRPVVGDGLGRLHLPAMSIAMNDSLKADLVYVDWQIDDKRVDRSWRLILYFSF
ncbi:MAG: hypothetical protein ABH875_06205 [Candidatus Omnitrophota bacterium]